MIIGTIMELRVSCASSALHVRIVQTRRMEYTFTRHIEYAIAVFVGDEYVTSSWQRYKRFNQLHRQLARKMGTQRNQLPRLPPKIRGRGADPAVVAGRREELCEYINRLLQSVPKTFGPLLDRFLGLDRAPEPLPEPEPERPAEGGRDEYDRAEIERAQQIAGECSMLAEELADELSLAGLPAAEVARVGETARALVEAVQGLAAQQHGRWGEALTAERERAALLDRSVRTLALQATPRGSRTSEILSSDDERLGELESSSDDDGGDDDLFFDVSENTPAPRTHSNGPTEPSSAAEAARQSRLDRLASDSRAGEGGAAAAGAGGRRTRLAAYKDFGEVSMWSFLKEVIGQDLTRITFPVAFNEPLTLLQRAAEDMEYAALLDKAAACTDPEEKLVHVAVTPPVSLWSRGAPACPCS